MVGYIGPNGAGKSTTIKMLTGILVPSSGRITVDGRVPHQQRVEHVRGLVALPNEDGVALPSITASFGVAQLSSDTLNLRDAMERADRSLYQAKREGRNRTVIDHWPNTAEVDEDTPTN